MLKYYYDLSRGSILEIWGSSTKAPTIVFSLRDMLDNQEVGYNFLSSILTEFSWLLHCASKMACPSTACEIVQLAMSVKEQYDKLLNE